MSRSRTRRWRRGLSVAHVPGLSPGRDGARGKARDVDGLSWKGEHQAGVVEAGFYFEIHLMLNIPEASYLGDEIGALDGK